MGPDAFQPLRDGLWSDDAIVRRESLRSIGKLKERAPLDPAAVTPLLLQSMRDADGTVRAVAATYLGIVGSPPEQAVPALTTGLTDDNPEVRARGGHRARRVRRGRHTGAAGAQEGQRRSQRRRRARSGPRDAEGAGEVGGWLPVPSCQFGSGVCFLPSAVLPCWRDTFSIGAPLRTSTTSRYRSSASRARWWAA